MMDEKAAEYVNNIVKEGEDDVIDALRLYEAYKDGWSAAHDPENNLPGKSIIFFMVIGALAIMLLLYAMDVIFNITIFAK